jgi:hypothetical protein
VCDALVAVSELQGRFARLCAVGDQIDAVRELLLLPKSSSCRSSTESLLIESALEAFSFLESEDYVCDVLPYESSDEHIAENATPNNSPSTVLTMRTTDSGIGSIANRPKDRRTTPSDPSRLESSKLTAPDSPIAADTEPPDVTTGDDDVDEALRWHLSYTVALLRILGRRDELRFVDEALKQAAVLQQLVNIVTSKGSLDFTKIVAVLTPSEYLAKFWRQCAAGDRLVISSQTLVAELSNHCADRLALSHGIRNPKYVFDIVLSRLLDLSTVKEAAAAAADDEMVVDVDVISQTVTLHRFVQFFADCGLPTVPEYISQVATYCMNNEFSLPDIVQKTCELSL